jgi:hypothetical protein
MNELKYIVMIPPGFNTIGARAIIFNGLFTHSVVAKGFIEEGWTVNSAGFLDLKHGVTCFGRSESLNVESEPFFDQLIVSQTMLKKHPLIGFTME